MLAKINGLFRLTRDAELKYTQTGTAILNLGLACSEKYKDNETQLFLDATVFGKPAEIISQYAGEKGTQIYLSGKLQTESWTTQDNQKRSKTVMIVEGFDFVSNGSKQQSQPQQQSYQQPQQQHQQSHTAYQPQNMQQQPNQPPEIDVNEESLPF